jgi:hypothetical protein
MLFDECFEYKPFGNPVSLVEIYSANQCLQRISVYVGIVSPVTGRGDYEFIEPQLNG